MNWKKIVNVGVLIGCFVALIKHMGNPQAIIGGMIIIAFVHCITE